MDNNEKQPQGIKWYHPAFLISTWFGIGKIPFAPGTWGSFFTFPLFIASHYLLLLANSESGFHYIFLALVAFLFIIGTWATNVYMKHTGKHDPKEVVIDEVVGQMLVFLAGFSTIASGLDLFSIFYESGMELTAKDLTEVFTTPVYLAVSLPVYLLCFILFRIFDIWKPWPIGYCDKNIKGGFGVMFDDIFASVYAIIVLYGIALIIAY